MESTESIRLQMEIEKQTDYLHTIRNWVVTFGIIFIVVPTVLFVLTILGLIAIF